jgi:hypothetical protein
MKMKVSRRRLIQGALATPMVLTVRSAAGTGAALGSAGACRVVDRDRYRDGQVKKSLLSTNDETIKYVRKEYKVGEIRKKSNKAVESGHYLLGDDGFYWKVVRSGDNCDVTKSSFTTTSHEWHKDVRKEYGLRGFDSTYSQHKWIWEKPDYSPLTGSCWSSLKV